VAESEGTTGNKREERYFRGECEKIRELGERSVVMTSGMYSMARALTQQYPLLCSVLFHASFTSSFPLTLLIDAFSHALFESQASGQLPVLDFEAPHRSRGSWGGRGRDGSGLTKEKDYVKLIPSFYETQFSHSTL
jgi:hypothetical protein